MRTASEWIARLHADDVNDAEQAQFEAWRSAHPLHARACAELSQTWARFRAAAPLVHAVSFAQSINDALAVTAVEAPAVRSASRRGWVTWAAAAVITALAAGLGWLSYERFLASSTFRTAIGEYATVALPDGSKLELNSNSRARVDFSEKNRTIHLEQGEAFFNVAHDTQRPFWVVAGGSWVRAVGTAFNVDLHASSVRVTVSEGTVKVGTVDPLFERLPLKPDLDKSKALYVLTAGQEARMQGLKTETRRLSAGQLARSVAWREGTLYFENQPLGDVIDELGRYTPLQLVINDESLRRRPVGGTFQASPQGAETLLTMLEQGLRLRVHREANRVVIERAPGMAVPK